MEILIAEDSPTQAEQLRYILEQQGYRVAVAHNGREALSSVRRSKPTIVLSDIVMPEMDGYELCRQIRDDPALQDLPVILLTSLSDPKDVIRALECGATNFITKPYDEEHLLTSIHHVLMNMELRRDATVELGVNILFAGERHFITAERLQILDLLLATYETAVRENGELTRVRDELQRLNEHLEETVEERTTALTRGIAVNLALQQVRNQILQMREETDWEKVVAVFEGKLRGLVAFRACSINLVDPSKDAVTIYYTLSEKVGARAVSHLAPALRQALDTGRCVYRHNLEKTKAFGDEVGRWGETIQSVVDVPFAGGTVAVNSLEADAFTEADVQVLEQFAQVAAEAYRRLEDIKALAEAEARFQQAQKLESLGRLAAGVAHDFNNLLTIITGNTQLLLHASGLDQRVQQRVQEIQEAGERAVGLVRQLLVFGRRQVLQPQIVGPNQLIADLGRMLRRVIGEDIELVTALEADPGKVAVDPGQVEQVLMNLAVNARDAMPQGGKLVLETSSVQLDEQYIATHAVDGLPGPYVLLSVSDTGTGMTPEVQARIFEPFFTTKEPGRGTGLGLATVYGIVKQSGGHISMYTEVGHGTTFRIYLPRLTADSGQLAAGEGGVPERQWRGQETVLVVEDDEGVRSLAVQLLQDQGYTVLQAQSGAEALLVLAEQGEAVRLVLTDVIMPGMQGRELGEEVGRSYPQVKVIYMSGYSEHTALPREVQTNAETFIQKPFGPDDLARKVRQALDRP
ncbi:MAG: response regulator [Gemmatimonadota bacterium]